MLLFILLISGYFAFNLKNIYFDYDFEAFFSEEDVETDYFEAHRKRFESDNDFIFIAIENEGSVFEQSFLENVARFVDTLEGLPFVDGVQSLTHMDDFVKTPFSPIISKRPYLSIDQPSKLSKDSVRIFERPELAGMLIREDAKALLILIKHAPFLSKQKCDLLKTELDVQLANFNFHSYKYAGRAIGMGYYIDAMQFETVFFVGLSFVLVILFLIASFRSVWGVVIPLIIVAFYMLWIVGFIAAVGQPINLVLTVLPSIIFVVAMSDVIHLVTKYFDELRLGKNQLEAVKIAYKEIGFATLLTSLTTAVGFMTLLTVGMQPVEAFGIYTAIGVVFAFVLAYTLLPALLILTKPPKIVQVGYTKNMWYPILHKTFRFVLKQYRGIAITFVGIIIIAGVGLSLMQADYFLLEDLKDDSSLKQDYDYFDKEFMGLRPFEMSIEVKQENTSIYDYDVLQEINKIDSFLLSDYGLKRAASVIQILKIANRTEHGGKASYYKFPNKADSDQFLGQIKKFDKKGMLQLFVDSTAKYARISSTIGDIGMYAINEKNERFHSFYETAIDTNLIAYHFTGTGHLLDRNMSNLSKNLTYGLLLALLIVSLLMGFLYKSVRIVLIALVPNILPLLMLGAILGFAGIDLKVSTAIIFTISFGIAVDDTIHFMSKLKLEINKGKPFLYALKRTYLSTGRAIILTTLILCSGFLLLMFSDFLGTFYVGLLISATLIFALLADLLFLPVLLLFFYNKDKAVKK
jgi:hypothetical protein